jgi:hypothetical protein
MLYLPQFFTRKKGCILRKTHMKLGSLLVMTCLFLAVGMSMGVGHASAQQAQAAKKFHHWFAQAPHITIKMLPSTAAHHVSRLVISGVGFTNCCPSASSCDNGCGTSATTSTCDNGCGTSPNTSPNTSNPCDNATCSTTTSQTSSTDTDTNITTTTTTTNTTSPSTTTYTVSAPSNTSPASVPGNTAPATTPSDACSSYDSCSSTAPSTTDTSTTDTSPADSSTNCACGNTVDLQSSAPLYASGINLARIPVNTFGEFNITVNLHPRRFVTRHYNTVPTIWAINSYNEQPSNYASVPCSCSSSCCQ